MLQVTEISGTTCARCHSPHLSTYPTRCEFLGKPYPTMLSFADGVVLMWTRSIQSGVRNLHTAFDLPLCLVLSCETRNLRTLTDNGATVRDFTASVILPHCVVAPFSKTLETSPREFYEVSYVDLVHRPERCSLWRLAQC